MLTNKIALGFVLYNPHIVSIQRIINSANYGYAIYVYINSIHEDGLKSLTSHKSLNLIFGESNGGLSKGLTFICNAAYNSKFKALLYFDQDTVFENTTLDYISSYYDFILERNDDFCKSIVCTTFRNLPYYRRLNHISSHKYSNFIIENVFFTINSGSLYFLEKIKDYQWFDERYFVDGVDYSFCINSIKNKLKITEVYHSPGIDHEKEQGNLSVMFFHKQLIGRVYPFRRNIDFVQAHVKLLFSAFCLKSIKPLIFIIKSLSFYLFQQVLFRIKTGV
jgi:rhamnosyltransferase